MVSGIAFEQHCIANFCLQSHNLAQVGKDGEFMFKLLTV